jgi:hypothetical protein
LVVGVFGVEAGCYASWVDDEKGGEKRNEKGIL